MQIPKSATCNERNGRIGTNSTEECVEAGDFLLLLKEGVILCNTAKSQLFHEIDLIWLVHVLVLMQLPCKPIANSRAVAADLEVFDQKWEGSREEQHLSILGHKRYKFIEDLFQNECVRIHTV